MLQEVARRIQGCLRASDTVARLGGDEFGIVLTSVAGDADVVAVIDRIGRAHVAPIAVQEMSVDAEASIGVAVYPDHGDDMETLSRHADVAMYAAKQQNRAYTFYDPDQPQAVLATGEVHAVEALLALAWRSAASTT